MDLILRFSRRGFPPPMVRAFPHGVHEVAFHVLIIALLGKPDVRNDNLLGVVEHFPFPGGQAPLALALYERFYDPRHLVQVPALQAA